MSTTHLAQELLMNVECNGGSRSFANWKGEQTWYVSASRAAWKSKKSLFWSVVFSFYTQQQWTIFWSDYDMVQWKVDFKQWPAKTSSVVGLRKSSRNALQSQTFTKKKKSWSLFGGLLPVWSTTAFWILAKPLHLRSMLSKLMRCTKNCDACS